VELDLLQFVSRRIVKLRHYDFRKASMLDGHGSEP
jgi:hypothetical protein